MCVFVALAANAATISPKLVKTISASETAAALDKDNQMLPVTIEYQGNNARFTVYDANLSNVKKQFILNDVYNGNAKGPEPVYPFELATAYQLNSNVFLTQTLFNADEKWEVVIRTGDEYDYSSGKFDVYNEDGLYLGEVPSTNDLYEGKTESMEYIYLNGEFFLVGYNDSAINFYSCNPAAASVPSIELGQSTAHAYPNPLPAGHSLTIELASPADEATTVEVYDINGRLITSAKATAGETKVAVPSRRLRNGNFVYTVISNGQTIEQGKIIAK